MRIALTRGTRRVFCVHFSKSVDALWHPQLIHSFALLDTHSMPTDIHTHYRDGQTTTDARSTARATSCSESIHPSDDTRLDRPNPPPWPANGPSPRPPGAINYPICPSATSRRAWSLRAFVERSSPTCTPHSHRAAPTRALTSPSCQRHAFKPIQQSLRSNAPNAPALNLPQVRVGAHAALACRAFFLGAPERACAIALVP